MSLNAFMGHRLHLSCVGNMTNPKVDRKSVYSEKEVDGMIEAALGLGKYERLRARALIALFRSGKRRAEVAGLEMNDLQVKENYLYVTFAVVKKRKKTVNVRRRTKRYHVKGRFAELILEYWDYLRNHHPKCRYLFPSRKNVFGEAFVFYEDKHLSGRQVLRIIKELNPDGWCHLFRETRGATIVREDEAENGQVSLYTVYKVKHALDLERETTAWNYINRYASEVIEEDKERLEEID